MDVKVILQKIAALEDILLYGDVDIFREQVILEEIYRLKQELKAIQR